MSVKIRKCELKKALSVIKVPLFKSSNGKSGNGQFITLPYRINDAVVRYGEKTQTVNMNESKFNTINVYILNIGQNTPAAKKRIRKKFDEPKTPECNLNCNSKLGIFLMNKGVSVVTCSLFNHCGLMVTTWFHNSDRTSFNARALLSPCNASSIAEEELDT